MTYKYWNVSYDGEDGLFSQEEFKTKDLLIEHLYDIDLEISENDISEINSEYEIKSVCLSTGRYDEYRFMCPYCGWEYNPDKEFDIYEFRRIDENFEFFNSYTKICDSRDCNKMFVLKNDYGESYEV